MRVTGEVTPFSEAIVRVKVPDAEGSAFTVEAVLDTGFTGYLTLPADVIVRLGLPYERTTRTVLAVGSVQRTRVYTGMVQWGDEDVFAPIFASDGVPLLGMDLMRGSLLTMEIVDGGRVLLEPLA